MRKSGHYLRGWEREKATKIFKRKVNKYRENLEGDD